MIIRIILSKEGYEGWKLLRELNEKQQKTWENREVVSSQASRGSWALQDIDELGLEKWMKIRDCFLRNYSYFSGEKGSSISNAFVIAAEISSLLESGNGPVNYTKLRKALEGHLSDEEFSSAFNSFLLDFMFVKYYCGISNPGEERELVSNGLIEFTS
ncbi:MAG: hypothetical protein KAI57_02125 [Candidatus Pacebacteria bacterium]|nr:hypothetical protein [Candidatus Paceibacterota bacterium]